MDKIFEYKKFWKKKINPHARQGYFPSPKLNPLLDKTPPRRNRWRDYDRRTLTLIYKLSSENEMSKLIAVIVTLNFFTLDHNTGINYLNYMNSWKMKWKNITIVASNDFWSPWDLNNMTWASKSSTWASSLISQEKLTEKK